MAILSFSKVDCVAVLLPRIALDCIGIPKKEKKDCISQYMQ